jgi:hypothetical protein
MPFGTAVGDFTVDESMTVMAHLLISYSTLLVFLGR